MKFAPILLLAGLASCASAKHLIFFTNTTIGLEVSAESNAPTPAKFVLGYKRQEGVIDPIMDPECTFTPSTTPGAAPFKQECGNLMPEAHSVLAKMNFGAQGGGASASAAQWFATGQAAINLSDAPGIAGAVTGSAEIAKAAALESSFLGDASIPDDIKIATLATVFQFIEGVDSAESRAVLTRLDEFAKRYSTVDVPLYSYTGDKSDISREDPGFALNSDHNAILEYDGKLAGSIGAIQHLMTDATAKEAGAPAPPDATRRTELLAEFELQKSRLREFHEAVRKAPAVIDALAYFGRVVLGKEGSR